LVSDLQLTRRVHHLKFPFSVPETIEFGKATLQIELEQLWAEHNLANECSTHVEAEYLEVIARRA
jgi:ABC-type hemin transport system ATPase subunit